MFGPSCLRLRRNLVVFCLCTFLTFSWFSQTAVAQTSRSGVITGTVQNGTTNAPAPQGTPITLHAYNSSYTAADTLTTTLDENGRFQFNLTDNPSDWVYMVSTNYQNLSFSSTIAALSGAEPLDLSLTVYDTTRDPANVVIDHLSMSLTQLGQTTQVSELYTFANVGTAVYIGTDLDGIQINLPNAAQTPTFERGLGPNSGFFPADDVIQQDGRWLDTAALRPGPNSLTLRVTYTLPSNELDLTRTLPYPTNSVLLAIPDDLQFASDDWQQQATQSAGERGAMRQFTQSDLAANSVLGLTFNSASFALQTTANAFATATTSDLAISLVVLLLVTSVAFRLLKPGIWRTAVPQLATSTGPALPIAPQPEPAERWQLLFALADLDNAYKHGQVPEAEYQHKRQEIKTRLRNIWEIA
ncbi:MAG: hypothetical protein KC445_10820 [Anaerolineales bacterium]|nr:hypothetical protein [Anaerolineales bacterium]